MKKLRAFYRLLLFAAYTSLRIVQILALSLFQRPDLYRSMRIRRSWARWLLYHLGVRIETSGTPPDFPCIVMANHRSYLDPIVLICDIAGFPVSKAEVARWPIIGYGARLTGVLFLRRESARSRSATLGAIGEKVQQGFPVILFPEGTTHDLPATLALKRGGFQLAAQGSFPIVPVAIDYAHQADYWIGDDTFLAHFFRRFGERRMPVFVHYGPVLHGHDAQDLLLRTKTWIDLRLLDMRAEMGVASGQATAKASPGQ